MARPRLDKVREELRQSVDELRKVARGIYPAELNQGGLAAALSALHETLDIPGRLILAGADPAARFRSAIEYTTYLAVMEAVDLLRRHQGEAAIDVTADLGPEAVRVAVSAPDPGPAVHRHSRYQPSDLVADRVASLQGSMQMTHPTDDTSPTFCVIIPVIP
jgi:signal transduction histidine kinase